MPLDSLAAWEHLTVSSFTDRTVIKQCRIVANSSGAAFALESTHPVELPSKC